MNLNRILENTIEKSKNMIEVQIGAFSLVAIKQVAINIPVPYTALNAENNIIVRNVGDLERRAKNDNFRSSMESGNAFPTKYHAFQHNKPSKWLATRRSLMQSINKGKITLNGGYCANCLRLEKTSIDANGRCADCASMHFAID